MAVSAIETSSSWEAEASAAFFFAGILEALIVWLRLAQTRLMTRISYRKIDSFCLTKKTLLPEMKGI